jgi:hypothetical protein
LLPEVASERLVALEQVVVVVVGWFDPEVEYKRGQTQK